MIDGTGSSEVSESRISLSVSGADGQSTSAVNGFILHMIRRVFSTVERKIHDSNSESLLKLTFEEWQSVPVVAARE